MTSSKVGNIFTGSETKLDTFLDVNSPITAADTETVASFVSDKIQEVVKE